jgi:hypothetical protein
MTIDMLLAKWDEQNRRQSIEQQIVFESQSITKGQSDPTPLQEIFGLPPDNLIDITNRKMLDSMPVCHFSPSVPDFTRGLDLFTLKSAWDEVPAGDASLIPYTKLLEEHGFSTPNTAGQGIKVAYLADSFPTDTFTNEYGENFLQKFTDVASEGMASIAQMMGTKSGITALERLISPLKNVLPENLFGINTKKGAETAGKTAKQWATSALTATKMQNAATMIDRLAAGARIDFPQVWKSSGFQPSYTMTIRLYNPNPRSIESTKRYIVGPVTALMLLAVPTTQDGSTYSWPFLHKITSPGIFELNPGFIGNITIIKGGDQQQISQQQRLGIVDVRIDIGSLFSTMVAGGTKIQQKTRPTVNKYINAMLNPVPKRHEIYNRTGRLKMDSKANLASVQRSERNFRTLDRSLSAKIAQEKEDSEREANDRVPKFLKDLGDGLAAALPPELRVPFIS